MEKEIVEKIDALYRGHWGTAILFSVLIVVTVLVTVGVIKYKLFNAKWKNVALIALVALVSAGLIISQIVAIVPVYRDRCEESYTVIENARLIVKDGATGIPNRTNRVLLYDGEEEIELIMQTDYHLDTETEYTGRVAYLRHSNYLIGYDLDRKDTHIIETAARCTAVFCAVCVCFHPRITVW